MVEDGILTQRALLSAATLPEQSQKAKGETTLSVSFPAGGAPWEVGEVNFWAARGDSGMQPDAAAPQADARALSRAIERDARRYDGGFTLY